MPNKGKATTHKTTTATNPNFFFFIILALVFLGFLAGFSPFINFLAAPNWPQVLLFYWRYGLRYPLIVFDTVLIVFIFYLLAKISPQQNKVKLFHWRRFKAVGYKLKQDRHFIRQWQRLSSKLTTAPPENLRLIVIDAEALLDTFLQKAGYEGEHFAERLAKVNPAVLRSVEKVWDAHRLRNSLVHVPGFKVSTKEATQALKSFEDFLKELGAI